MNLRPYAVLLTAALFSACGTDAVQSITAAPAGAAVKFFNYGVGSPGVNLYANGTKVTAISSSACVGSTDTLCTTIGKEATTGTTYGNVASGGFYTAMVPGSYTFNGRTPTAAATDPGINVSALTATLADGKYYSLYDSGIYSTATKTVDAFIVEDPIPTTIDRTLAYVRFVNAVANGTGPMQLYAKNVDTGVEVAVGGPITYKSATPFVTLAQASSYTLSVRYVGSSTNIATATAAPTPGRVATISIRGDATSSATATKPTIDVSTNR